MSAYVRFSKWVPSRHSQHWLTADLSCVEIRKLGGKADERIIQTDTLVVSATKVGK
jgi:hypothetical protein